METENLYIQLGCQWGNGVYVTLPEDIGNFWENCGHGPNFMDISFWAYSGGQEVCLLMPYL